MSTRRYGLSTMPSSDNKTGHIASGLTEEELYSYLRSQFSSFKAFSESLRYRLALHSANGTARFLVDQSNTFKAGYAAQPTAPAYAFVTREK
jgi:hypothetical protein